jgi:hypothetical protein
MLARSTVRTNFAAGPPAIGGPLNSMSHGKGPFMTRLNRWLSVSQATRKAAQLLFGAVLLATVSLAAAAPARADGCPYVTGGRLSFTNPDRGGVDLGQQITLSYSADDVAFLRLQVNLSNGNVANVTMNKETTYSAGTGTGGIFYSACCEYYRPGLRDINKQFPLYAIYHDPCKNVNWTFTVSLHVIP